MNHWMIQYLCQQHQDQRNIRSRLLFFPEINAIRLLNVGRSFRIYVPIRLVSVYRRAAERIMVRQVQHLKVHAHRAQMLA